MTDGNGHREISGSFRVASWNLLRRIGAEAEDVAKLVRAYRPDLLLLQEATEEIAASLASLLIWGLKNLEAKNAGRPGLDDQEENVPVRHAPLDETTTAT